MGQIKGGFGGMWGCGEKDKRKSRGVFLTGCVQSAAAEKTEQQGFFIRNCYGLWLTTLLWYFFFFRKTCLFSRVVFKVAWRWFWVWTVVWQCVFICVSMCMWACVCVSARSASHDLLLNEPLFLYNMNVELPSVYSDPCSVNVLLL